MGVRLIDFPKSFFVVSQVDKNNYKIDDDVGK